MVEERYYATTQNRFYPDMSNVNKKYFSGGKTYQPTYVHTNGLHISQVNSSEKPQQYLKQPAVD